MTCSGSMATGSAAPSRNAPIIGIKFSWLASSAAQPGAYSAPTIPAAP